MQLSFLTVAVACLSVFGGASQALANPLMEVLSITLTGPGNNLGKLSNGAFGGGVEVNALREQYCADPRKATPLYRAWQPTVYDHFYTADQAEYDRAAKDLGYTKEGIAGYVFPDAQLGTAPLYRLWNPKSHDHFYTMSAEERDRAVNQFGFTSEGVTGYIYTPTTGPFCGSVPLYRLYHAEPLFDHFYTASEEERINALDKLGYADEGVTGWLLRY